VASRASKRVQFPEDGTAVIAQCHTGTPGVAVVKSGNELPKILEREVK